MLNETVRGIVPEPGLFSLPGLDRMRIYQQRRLPATPHARLLGYRLTQVTSGSSIIGQPVGPWSEIFDGFVDLTATAALSVYVTASTAAPAGTQLRLVTLSVRYLRPFTIDEGSVIARGRILHAGSSFTTVETLVEDPLGRAVAHVTGTAVGVALDPPPPPWSGAPDEPAVEPTYPTPDPIHRSLPASLDRTLLPPAAALLGMKVDDVSDTRAVATMPASRWFCNAESQVEPGVVASLGNYSAALLPPRLAGPDHRAVTFETSMSLLKSVPADGRLLRACATLNERVGSLFVVDTRVEDADGTPVLIGRGTLQQQRRRPGQQSRPANRVLLTVLFTDLVGSTERAGADGDAKWRALLEEHHAIVRNQLQLHAGREVKTTGDGFLATFDSPSRAVQCAQAVRTGVATLGLQIRAGVHTGECELMGADVAGLAVHVASRVQSTASPGEILVSHTVRDLAVGSGLKLIDRGIHELRGLSGTWPLFAVGD